MRLHKESPEILRFGFRRAGKGYGGRVSRQCTISGGFAAAWGAAGDAAGAAVAAGACGLQEKGSCSGLSAGTPAGGDPPAGDDSRVDGGNDDDDAGAAGLALEEGSASPVDVRGRAFREEGFVGAPDVSRSDGGGGGLGVGQSGDSQRRALRSPMARTLGEPGVKCIFQEMEKATVRLASSPPAPIPGMVVTPSQRLRNERQGAAEEALSEVVRLVMGMFDSMCSPGENIDMTLLSVGLAGFRSLGGGAQAGIARCEGNSGCRTTLGVKCLMTYLLSCPF